MSMLIKRVVKFGFLLSLSSLCWACGPTYDEGEDARIRVTPAQHVTFSRVDLGGSRMLPVVVSNVGRDPLRVFKVEWTGSTAVGLSMDGYGFPQVIDQNGSVAIAVAFSPTAAAASPEGKIRIYSSDIDRPVYELDVVTQQRPPQIHVVPSQEEKLVFPQTEQGESTTKHVVVTNSGDLPLVISDVTLSASSAFSMQILNGASLPLTLSSDSSQRLNLRVTFSPATAAGREEGALVFASNDPQRPQYALPIVANSDLPCLLVQPTILEFSPAMSIGVSHKKSVLLTSCGSVALTISGVAKASGGEIFTHRLSGHEAPLASGQFATLDITYTPDSEGTHRAEYVVFSDDPLQANATVTVMAMASANQCPTASVRGRISSASEWSKSVDAAPLDTIILDGSFSSDPESSTLTYYWTVASAPKDSTSKIASQGASASFFADLAGRYSLCLSVEDSAGMMSCNTDCVTVEATPRQTLHTQLVWHTPANTMLGNGEGTDLDLHFLRLPNGFWGDRGTPELNNGTDVYFLNQAPVWTIPGFGNEYPSLDRDDKIGAGPENVNLDAPAPCSWYALGVHYYQDNAFGPSYATVRVYVSGRLRFEKANISFRTTGMFKVVTFIHWDGSTARMYEADLAYDTDEQWIGKTPAIPEDVIEKAKASAPSCF